MIRKLFGSVGRLMQQTVLAGSNYNYKPAERIAAERKRFLIASAVSGFVAGCMFEPKKPLGLELPDRDPKRTRDTTEGSESTNLPANQQSTSGETSPIVIKNDKVNLKPTVIWTDRHGVNPPTHRRFIVLLRPSTDSLETIERSSVRESDSNRTLRGSITESDPRITPTLDTETRDTQTPDTETRDTQTPDIETRDTETPDTETRDTQTPDTETRDTQTPDTETPDTEPRDTQTPDTETRDT